MHVCVCVCVCVCACMYYVYVCTQRADKDRARAIQREGDREQMFGERGGIGSRDRARASERILHTSKR